mgnify:CR=1 FL=1|tara:strand:- start:323 stop:598 length:276 start_codon:yes stop_codon:yes gene_type:complete
MSKVETDNYSAFEGLNLSNARGEDESYKLYKLRIKQNQKILSMYNKIGRDAFKELFPAGVSEYMKDNSEGGEVENNPTKSTPNLDPLKINK